MEKNLSIIQGLTDADQANPIRITDAGELKIATTSSQIAVDGALYADAMTGEPYKYVNAIAGNYYQPSAASRVMYEVNVKDGDINPTGDIDPAEKKLLVEQGKQFRVYQVKFYDCSANPGSLIKTNIEAAIGDWIAANGRRYDDIIITPFVSNDGSGNIKYLMTVTIIRYY